MKVVAKTLDQYDGKLWVIVTFNGTRTEWVPSFEDLFRIVQAICHCEDEKYPPPAKGRSMVKELLIDCCEKGIEWETLREKYKIPSRE
jgi:hypothetical protein